jgi:hypothetical protein
MLAFIEKAHNSGPGGAIAAIQPRPTSLAGPSLSVRIASAEAKFCFGISADCFLLFIW